MNRQPANDPKCTWIITTTDKYQLPPNTSKFQCTKEKINGYPGYCVQHMKRWETSQWKIRQRLANEARQNI